MGYLTHMGGTIVHKSTGSRKTWIQKVNTLKNWPQNRQDTGV